MRQAEEIIIHVSRSDGMDENTIYDEASAVEAEQGSVIVKGPDAVNVKLTPDAAEETSERLLEGAMKARGQRYFDESDA